MIHLNELTKKFGRITAVDGISFSVVSGEVLGFLGPNGAGKSTTMKMLTGYLPITSGQASVCGFDVVDEELSAKNKIGYLPEGAPLYGDMTGLTFLNFVAEIRGFRAKTKKTKVELVIDKLELGTIINKPIETLSKGFKRRVGLAQAIIHDPEVLILDEPTDGLDPNQKHQVRALIKEMSANKAIVISTHLLEEVSAVCSRAVIIASGKIVFDGTPDEFSRCSRHHNSVIIRFSKEKGEKIQSKISALGDVEQVELLNDGSIRAIPKNGAMILQNISNTLRENKIEADELFVEAGQLEEVFRELTVAT